MKRSIGIIFIGITLLILLGIGCIDVAEFSFTECTANWFPLAVGNWWEYEYEYPDGFVFTGRVIITHSVFEIGVEKFYLTSDMGGLFSYMYIRNDSLFEETYMGMVVLHLIDPCLGIYSWHSTASTVNEIIGCEDVNLETGLSFTNCLHVRHTEPNAIIDYWYAKDVGRVLVIHDLDGEMLYERLSDYHIEALGTN